jgi:hypothetical protein
LGLVTQRLHITPNAFGVLDGRDPSNIGDGGDPGGGGTGPTIPVLTWAAVPSTLQNLEGTPFSVDISVYLTSTTGDTISFTLAGGTWPTGWSISDTGTISYNGTGVGAADVTIRATQTGVSADSNNFTVESIAVANADQLAPTIPTGLALVSKTSSTIDVTCDAPSDVSASSAVPYTGMKEVRFFKNGVLDTSGTGVSSMSTGLSLRLSQKNLSDGSAGGRKVRPGHYTVLSDSNVWSGVPYHGGTYTGIPNATHLWDTGPVTTDSAGIVLRRRWSALELTTAGNPKNYDFSSITTALSQLAALSLTQDPTGVQKIMLIVLIEVRTFTGGDTWDIPLPSYLVSIADGGTGAKTYGEIFTSTIDGSLGFQSWRWAPTLKTGFQQLVAAIGAQFDSHPNFGGIATQETSSGSPTGGTGVGEAYSKDNFVQALKDEGTYIGLGCPTSRHYWYYNHIHSGATADLQGVAAFLSQYGAVIGFPDLVMQGGLLSGYSICTNQHNGNGTGGVTTPGYTFGSVQQAEWAGARSNGTNFDPADPRLMTDLFNYLRGVTADDLGHKPLKGDMIFWNWITTAQTFNLTDPATGAKQQFNPSATTQIHAHPTFGTITPSSTFAAGTLTQSNANYTIASNGAGIGGTSDEWTCGQVQVTGDTTIIAKVGSVTGTTLTNALAGIAFRETNTPGSKAVHLSLSNSGVRADYRAIANKSSTTVTTGGATFDYYIGPTGSDSNAGTSASPWAITALNTKRATYSGKTVGLLDGTYNLHATLNDGAHTSVDVWALDVDGGTSGAPTIIKAVNARLAILTGKTSGSYGNPNGTPMLGHSGNTTHRGYVTFDGLKITGMPRDGIRIGIYGVGPQIAGITIKNCEFTDFSGTAQAAGLNLSTLEFNQCTGHLVQNNYFHDNVGYAAGSADHFSSTLQWGSDRGTYEYNTVENSGSIYAKELGQYGHTIQYNYIDVSYSTDGISNAIADFSGYNGSSSTTTSIHHNIMIGSKGWDGRDVLDNAEYSRDLVRVYNNTIVVKASLASGGICVKATAGNGSIYNNIISDESTGDHFGVAYNIDIDGIADYNCYYSTVSSLALSSYASVSATSRDSVSTIAAFRTATGAEAHSITTTPSFIGTGTRAAKYTLNGGGCVGTGKATGLIGGNACDMGAWGNNAPARIGCDFAP